MNFAARLSEEARRDIEEARLFLEERREGLGMSFTRDIELRIDEIIANPHTCRERCGHYRMAVTYRFHYRIFYRIAGAVIDIVAVWHSKRHPTSWMERLR